MLILEMKKLDHGKGILTCDVAMHVASASGNIFYVASLQSAVGFRPRSQVRVINPVRSLVFKRDFMADVPATPS